MSPLRLRVHPPGGTPFERSCEGETVVGRASSADLSIADPYLSRSHARFVPEGADWFLESLSAKNVTLVNGKPVHGRVRLLPGDDVQAGETRIAVEPGERPAGRPPEAPRAAPGRGLAALEPVTVFHSAEKLLSSGVMPAAGKGDARLRRTVERLQLVNDVHRAVAGRVAVDELLELLKDRVFDLFRPEDVSVFLKGPDGELQPATSRRAAGATGQPFFSRALAREVTENGQAALVRDPVFDNRFSASESIAAFGVRSIAAAPLLDQEGCLGMIVVTSSDTARPFTEDDVEVLVSLASAVTLRLRTVALVDRAAEHRVLEKEIALAQDIQVSMLPRTFPDRPELGLAAALRAARSVGGDLYDYLELDGRLWVMVGDVSGKGVAAALHMAVARTLFRAAAPFERTPAAVLRRMNAELSRDNERAVFVTACVACLEVATGELSVANAGHNRPYVVAPDGSLRRVEEGAGMALGVDDGVEYGSAALRLAPRELFYLYTDGVTEAMGADGAMFGAERLEALLRRLAGRPAPEAVAETLREVQAFAGSAPQSDDIAVLVVRFGVDVDATLAAPR